MTSTGTRGRIELRYPIRPRPASFEQARPAAAAAGAHRHRQRVRIDLNSGSVARSVTGDTLTQTMETLDGNCRLYSPWVEYRLR